MSEHEPGDQDLSAATPQQPQGVRLRYEDGSYVVPSELRYLGYFRQAGSDHPSHVWRAVIFGRISGAVSVEMDAMPETSVVFGEKTFDVPADGRRTGPWGPWLDRPVNP